MYILDKGEVEKINEEESSQKRKKVALCGVVENCP